MLANDCEGQHLRRFHTYDRAVDVVSAFQALYTQTDDLKQTIAHFERFPTLRCRTDTGQLAERTPDFAAYFVDSTALIGEIARIAQHDGSVDSLCDQLGAYDRASELVADAGATVPIDRADVILLVPADVGPDAARRILDRVADSDHPYAPSAPPCVVQFLFDEGRYMFQRLPMPGNGHPDDGSRDAGLGSWFESSASIKVPPTYFAGIKAESAFMNDTPDRLYLATLLWTKVFPLFPLIGQVGSQGLALIEVRPDEIAAVIRERYGRIQARDVRAALGLLEEARLAIAGDGGVWRIGWQRLRRMAERDLARVIASRACNPPTSNTVDQVRDALGGEDSDAGEPLTLFE